MNSIEIYCDECRQDLLINKDIISEKNRYVILGGIWIDKNIREDFKTKVNALRKKYQKEINLFFLMLELQNLTGLSMF